MPTPKPDPKKPKPVPIKNHNKLIKKQMANAEAAERAGNPKEAQKHKAAANRAIRASRSHKKGGGK